MFPEVNTNTNQTLLQHYNFVMLPPNNTYLLLLLGIIIGIPMGR